VADIDRDRLIEDLETLVEFRSITGSEENVADWAAGALLDAGMRVEVVRPDLATLRRDPAWPGEEMPRQTLPIVAGRAGRASGRRIILSGHLDVVPAGDPGTWSVDPWAGEIRDD
jgi:acetylornithine deacetylase